MSHKVLRLELAKRAYAPRWSDQYYRDFMRQNRDWLNKDASIVSLRLNDEKEYDDYRMIAIPLGASRIGGPVVDLPSTIHFPEDHRFMGQLDLESISRIDPLGLLPKNGFLYFFVRPTENEGRAYYSDAARATLERVAVEHSDWYFSGKRVVDIRIEEETMESRYRIDERGIRTWDCFAGEDTTKIYGFYNDVQATEKEYLGRLAKGHVLLLQVGSDYMGEGAHGVFISKEALANLDFSGCEFRYSQT